MRHSQDCLGAGEPCCYGSLAPDDAFAHPAPSPVSCEHCGLPWGDGTAHATTAWACDPPAAAPSPGAVEADLIEYAWGIICNAGGGDWTRESADWQTAAARFREQYHAWIASAARRSAAGGQDG